jgi:two-component system, chemotaxis family, chemotaxis protein CheY
MAKILVVDDSAFMRNIIKKVLTQHSKHVICEVDNGEMAVEEYKKIQPALVFMDITMPVKSGLEALKEIREVDLDARVIMCSSMGRNTFIIDALRHGAKDFIVKPFQQKRILQCIEKHSKEKSG